MFRIAIMGSLVFGAEWSLADPVRVASSPELQALPWAMLCLLFPIGLGVWAYEVTSQGISELKGDFLWSVLMGTVGYVAVSLYHLLV